MQCSCGGETSPHSHRVTTPKGMAEWKVTSSHPYGIHVDQDRCKACGRSIARISEILASGSVGKLLRVSN